ncbi:hypothetical protein Poli38472_000557 [Pythium oligandrum]|uniref:P-type Cu(+) transporter n=1 Tax=Pythium oligandrum TaxID=41045 RepID=A0A8K1CCY4_PYTOL|nr:hypothetical protein Poli38472_000557 [Pythium oligandrum]|eukprot:TMW60515.1 hypothetical protein Poli38472_000557 [Pythium oligandrum]
MARKKKVIPQSAPGVATVAAEVGKSVVAVDKAYDRAVEVAVGGRDAAVGLTSAAEDVSNPLTPTSALDVESPDDGAETTVEDADAGETSVVEKQETEKVSIVEDTSGTASLSTENSVEVPTEVAVTVDTCCSSSTASSVSPKSGKSSPARPISPQSNGCGNGGTSCCATKATAVPPVSEAESEVVAVVSEDPVEPATCSTVCCSPTPEDVESTATTASCCSKTDSTDLDDSCRSVNVKKVTVASCCSSNSLVGASSPKASKRGSGSNGTKKSPCNAPKRRSSSNKSLSEKVASLRTNRENLPLKSLGSMRAIQAETLRLTIGGMTCSGCCTRIEGFMKEQPGMFSVNVSLLTSRGVFEYDPSTLTPAAIEKLISTLGFTPNVLPSDSLVSIVLHVGREHPVRVKKILMDINGVASVREDKTVDNNALPGETKVLLDFDPEIIGARTLVRKLSTSLSLVVQVSTPRPQALQSEDEEVKKFRNYLLWSCLLSLPIIFMEYLVPFMGVDLQDIAVTEIMTGVCVRNLVGMVFSTPILVIIAHPIHQSAYLALRYGSRVTMDVLISLSSICAYVFSVVTILLEFVGVTPDITPDEETFFEVTALLVTLILLGRYIEKIVKAKASHSVDALLQIQAKTAILLEKQNDETTKESYIDVLLVERGDLLKVLPGARVPTDGIVIEGSSSVDESMITGESKKVAKDVGSLVIGGTINAHGVLVMRVSHTINESMLARIVNLVDEAQSAKCASQSIADAVASYFTAFIICVAIAMFVVWYELARLGRVSTNGWAPFPFALRFAITVLVISCPCAISLAVPTAIMVATTVGSQFGVLFKGGQALEALDKVDVVMFDKTGTLTSGNLEVVDFLVASTRLPQQANARKLWTFLAAAESNSEHAIAKAIQQYAKKVHTPKLEAKAFESVPGCGVRCHVEGRVICAGSVKWMLDDLRVDVPLDLAARNELYQKEGCVVVCLSVDNLLCALVALQDTPRPEAQFVVEQLRLRKIQTWIVTGDQRETALTVAQELGIPDVTVISDALPHQKVDKVRLLQSIGKHVAFIGDGVNDGPALAMADIGIAIGTGTDVAIESADLVLVKDDLLDLLNALDLSKATNRLIRWNFTWAFLYNVLMMPLACGALYPFFGLYVPPAFAGLSELLSSVPVILFSLLLNFWKPSFHNNSKDDDSASDGSYVSIDVKQASASEATPLLHKY